MATDEFILEVVRGSSTMMEAARKLEIDQRSLRQKLDGIRRRTGKFANCIQDADLARPRGRISAAWSEYLANRKRGRNTR